MLYWSCWTFGRRVFLIASKLQHALSFVRANMHHREDLLVAQQHLSTLDWTRGKVTLANNVCIADDKQKSSNRWMFPCYRGICVTFIESCQRPPDLFFLYWRLLYLFLLKVEVCVSETCSCTKKTKSDLLARKEPDRCKFVCLFVFQSDLMYLHIPQWKQQQQLVPRRDEGDPDYDRSW